MQDTPTAELVVPSPTNKWTQPTCMLMLRTTNSLPVPPLSVCVCCSKRVFVLGPSHHVYLSGCALSPASVCETPLYNLPIDQTGETSLYRPFHSPLSSPLPLPLPSCPSTLPLPFSKTSLIKSESLSVSVYSELLSTGHFEQMSPTMDEEEHSIEMHLPYIAKVVSRDPHMGVM